MNYETMDWEAEAIRVARAFDLEGECRFIQRSGVWRLRTLDGRRWPQLLTGGAFKSRYDKVGYDYTIDGGVLLTQVHLRWDGSLLRTPIVSPMDNRAVRSLFHLDLLSPEVEEKLGVSITAHDKMEWTLEYEARYGL